MTTRLPSLAQFRARFPSLSTVGDDLVSAQFDRANLYMRSDMPQHFITEMALLLAAHELTLQGFGADAETAAFSKLRAAGVQRVTDGPTTMQFQTQASTAGQGAGAASDANFAQTRYGQELQALLDKVTPRGLGV